MALFEQYTKPGVYTRESVEDPGIILFGDLRIPVFVGEGQETFSFKNTEMHRGSSSVADDLVVKENLSDQVTGFTREFILGYKPVVKGDGTGTMTSTPSDIQILWNGVPATVTNLNGETGHFFTHSIPVPGDSLVASYYFKRKDTFILDEDLSGQVPAFAVWTGDPNTTLTLTTPGELGSSVSLALTSGGVAGATGTNHNPKTDSFAVSGAGSNSIEIELRKSAIALTGLTGDIHFGLTGGYTGASANTIILTAGNWKTLGVAVGDGVVGVTGANDTHTAGTHMIVTAISQTAGATGLADPFNIATVAGTLTPQILTGVNPASLEAYKIRNYGDINNLIDVGIPTPSGYITLQTSGSLATVAANSVNAVVPTLFRNGTGPSSNVVFKLKNSPVVDGSNGGVVTTNPVLLSAKVNNIKTAVKLVDGQSGIITMAQPILKGQTFTVSYYTNTYQDTYDMLPATGVASLDLVGFGPDREDFVNTVDYVLEQPKGKNARIQWGASSSTETGIWTAGYIPFDATNIVTTLVDQRMYLMPIQGTVDGINSIFTLPDVPTDGSGLSRVTNDPALVHVYIGTDPHTALLGGEVRVIQCFGAVGTIKLYTPPQTGNKIYATYYRNILNDHAFTLTVDTPGITGQGTYTVKDELGNVLPVIKAGNNAVTEADYTIAGTIWPYSFSDLTCVGGQTPDEIITVTFQAGDDPFLVTPATQGTIDPIVSNTALRLYSTITGNNTQSLVTVQFIDGGALGGVDGPGAFILTGSALTVNIRKANASIRTLQEMINLFTDNVLTATWPTRTGAIICQPVSSSSVLTTQAATNTAAPFVNGSNAVTTPRSLHYRVTSSRTAQAALTDGLGRTGGATTPVLGNWTGPMMTPVGNFGWLNQTYNDLDTGVNFTILNPDDALLGSYGYTNLPSPRYHFEPGDVLTFVVSASAKRYSGVVPTIDIYGVRTKVVDTYDMHSGDTAIVHTYNKAGSEPHVGDFYYVSYTTYKTPDDFALKIYTNTADAYAQYGPVNPTNKLSLAARLFAQNGGQVFGCIQVAKDKGLETAADQTFMTAISSLATPLPGSDRKADMIIPMTTSPVVIQYLNRHFLTQGSQRNSGEAVGGYGYDFYGTPDTMRALARSLKAERMIGIACPGAILEIDVDGKTAEFAVGGEFLAAAMTGMMLNPAIDVATTLTKQSMVGFSRLIRRYDDPTMDLMAADGLTCLVERSGAFLIRHWVTTDNTSPLKREPTSRLIIDYVRKIVRRNLNQFIGRKLLQSAINSVMVVTTSTLKALVEQEIVEGFKNLNVARDEYDPTVLHVSFTVKPIFSLLWIDVALTVTTKL